MKKYLFIIIGALALTSCKKWLDIDPQTAISKDELFNSQDGFEEALIGIYTRCTDATLYGGDLTFGTPDVMAQNYTYNFDNLHYQKTSVYDFKNSDFIGRRDRIWSGLYNAILNANLILLNIDQKKDLFTGNNYALIKGEALALRAYIHFDLFRLFGTYTIGGVSQGIPYVTTYSTNTTALSSAEEALTKMADDLNAAKVLLKGADSIVSNSYVIGYPSQKGQTETTSATLFQRDRRHRLNYYAVCGELARVCLYKGDKVNALLNATEVIQSQKFKLEQDGGALTSVLGKTKDRILYRELVFGWYLPQTTTIPKIYFEGSSNSLTMSQEFAASIFETGGVGAEDVRYKQWLEVTSDKLVAITKYKRETVTDKNDTTANLHPLMAPGIRFSEMYYIASECSYASSPSQAGSYLDAVRFSRSINQQADISTDDKYYTELLKEARKEWIGEGQIFYMYKRLNRNIPGQQGLVITPSKAKWVLPLPNDEIEFGGR